MYSLLYTELFELELGCWQDIKMGRSEYFSVCPCRCSLIKEVLVDPTTTNEETMVLYACAQLCNVTRSSSTS